MKVIAVGTLRDYWEIHRDAKEPLKAWFRETKAADWETPHDVEAMYRSASPVAAILFRMEQMGITRKDLEPLLGGRNRVSEVLSRKRTLSLKQIRRLHDGLKIPFENLIGTRAE